MSAEDMGRISRRLRFFFAVVSVVFVATLAVSPVKDLRQEWKRHKRGYEHFAESRADTKRLLADARPGIEQIWIPDLNVVDRCTTCHQGITQPSLADPGVPQPYRAHPAVAHNVKDWGCVICHRGQGAATEVAEAHETTLAWEQPLLPNRFIQGSCGTCHRNDLSEAPKLARGRQLLVQMNCAGCHKLQGVDRPEMLGPDLTNIGTKVPREWIYKWLKEPRTISDASGNTTTTGYLNQEEPRMPQFRLSEEEVRSLSAYLASLHKHPIETHRFDPQKVAVWEKQPDLVAQGEVRFRQMFCSTCHSLAVTRAGETKLIGGDIGPELTKVGSKVNRDWLVAWLRDPGSYLPHAIMPRYGWTDEDLFKVTAYITSKLTDPDLLSSVPKLGEPLPEEIQRGKRLFVEKGCASCHAIEGMASQKDFGPDLSVIGAKNVSQLEFGQSKIVRHLTSYIQAKITDPVSVNPAARMPQYHLTPEDLDAVTVSLLGMAGTPASGGLEKLVVRRDPASFRPAGEFGDIYARYNCSACHRFNGYGGDLAPDLSYEGSRAQRQWLLSFLKNPQTIRPTLVLRMPQFNMSDREATVIADYLGMVLRFPSDTTNRVESTRFTSQLAAKGKELYEVKYQCQSCHTIGASGGYVGPNLNNAGNWLTPAWVAAWLRNPQAIVPGTIEPRRAFTEDEIQALTAYLMTLKQSNSVPAANRSARKGAAQ